MMKQKTLIPNIFKKKDVDLEEIRVQTFLDMISPSIIRFYSDYFICGNTYRSIWAIREYPSSTNEQALLKYLGEKENVTLKIYTRIVTPLEEKKILANASNRTFMKSNTSTQMQDTIEAQADIHDLSVLIADLHRNKEPLVHTTVFIELIANSFEELKIIQGDVSTELIRSKINVDRLLLRQQEAFLSTTPSGSMKFDEEFERVLPCSSVANLFPFNYSGKTDPKGFYYGVDKYGSNIFIDFNRRSDDKTNANIIILGNSGQGKSYLLKLIITNTLCSGTKVIVLDPEEEYLDLTNHLNGDYLDLTSGKYLINVLEPKRWTDDIQNDEDDAIPDTFKKHTVVSQHIAFLKDFFKSYKNFNSNQLDIIEIMVKRLYDLYGINDETDLSNLKHTEYPTLSELYDLIKNEYENFNISKKHLYTEEMLRDVCLSLYSICKGAESKFFNGHTNIKQGNLVTFGVKGMLNTNENLKNALLFNTLSYMSNELLTVGNTAATLDEFYLFLSNKVAIEYIRNFMKRVRKKESSVIIASQNLEDFNLLDIKEYTKPLFSIPSHQFLFNAGNIDKHFYIENLQLEESEYETIKYPQRGICLYRCGNERYILKVIAPPHKEKLFCNAGGR